VSRGWPDPEWLLILAGRLCLPVSARSAVRLRQLRTGVPVVPTIIPPVPRVKIYKTGLSPPPGAPGRSAFERS